MHFRKFLYIASLLTSMSISAAEFPTGMLRGVGFIVEKGDQKITEQNLHSYESSVTVMKLSDGRYQFGVVADLQKTTDSPKKRDSRLDVYQIIWDSPTTGKLVNADEKFKEDRSNFYISNKQLVIKSWIARNLLWETHIYSIEK
jgi:uncharacterized surface protein with fasciclin (FAS1) repeats